MEVKYENCTSADLLTKGVIEVKYENLSFSVESFQRFTCERAFPPHLSPCALYLRLCSAFQQSAQASLSLLLQLNTTLKSLDLSGNAIDKSGTEAIAEALRSNSALEVLHIRSVAFRVFILSSFACEFGGPMTYLAARSSKALEPRVALKKVWRKKGGGLKEGRGAETNEA